MVRTWCAKRIKAQKQKEVPFFVFCLGSIHFANTFQELKRHFDVCENSEFDSMWGFDFPDDFDSEESDMEDSDWVKCRFQLFAAWARLTKVFPRKRLK